MARLTRRRWAAVLAAAAAGPAASKADALPLDVQAPRGQQGDDLDRAREIVRNNREAMAKVKIAISTEPAFRFHP
jgi:hypothetical protein